jgi:Fe-S-cluster containining protein
MSNRSYDDDPKEIKKLIEYHGCTPIKNAQGELGISIPMTCVHLGWDDEGKSFCKIHENKPVVCKEYYCGKVIEKALQGTK